MIDIILPTIGRDSLEASIESVIKQTYTNWHLWIMCEGYPVFDIYDYLEDRDSISIIDIKQRHYDSGAFARNYGITVSGLEKFSGKWICYLDDDDVYLPWHLETMQELSVKNPEANMLRTAGQVFYWKHKSPRSSKLVRKLGAVNSTDILTPGMCHSRELFNQTSGWKPLDNHDRELWFEMDALPHSQFTTTDRVTFEFER